MIIHSVKKTWMELIFFNLYKLYCSDKKTASFLPRDLWKSLSDKAIEWNILGPLQNICAGYCGKVDISIWGKQSRFHLFILLLTSRECAVCISWVNTQSPNIIPRHHLSCILQRNSDVISRDKILIFFSYYMLEEPTFFLIYKLFLCIWIT